MTITWVDDVTPLDAVNMNKLEQVARKGAANGYASLDASQNLPLVAASQIIWAGDTNLFRSAAGNLRTDGTFTVGGGIITGSNLDLRGDVDVYVSSQTAAGVICFRNLANATALFVMPDGKLAFSYGQDTTLYRAAAGQLKSNSLLVLRDGTADQVWLGQGVGPGGQAGIGLGSAVDATLYRSAAGRLASNADVDFSGDVSARAPGGASQVRIGYTGGNSGIAFGASLDANLYRVAAGILKTDGILWIGGSQLAFTNDTGTIYFGAASDVNLYRSAANVLKTDDSLVVVGGLQMDAGGSGYALQFGNAGDAMISRVAAGVLQMANQLQLQFPATGTAYKKLDLGAADSGGAGFRMVRVPN